MATVGFRRDRFLWLVSIHATLAGGDLEYVAYEIEHTEVSIHATLAGGDCPQVNQPI